MLPKLPGSITTGSRSVQVPASALSTEPCGPRRSQTRGVRRVPPLAWALALVLVRGGIAAGKCGVLPQPEPAALLPAVPATVP